ncbi:MAG: hypothetical protein KTR19_07545, partial [Hyphomicrobiales bacterium]|nr:hypothetical protein [Hyphomicrobiales bacterium]
MRFRGLRPTRGFIKLGYEAYRDRLEAARLRLRKNGAINRHYAGALIAASCNPQTTYADRFALWNLPPIDAPYAPGSSANLHVTQRPNDRAAEIGDSCNRPIPNLRCVRQCCIAAFPKRTLVMLG